MNLVILHFHFRPGGVRRVIELAAPDIARRLGPESSSVVLASGEPPDPAWFEHFRGLLEPHELTCAIEPALRYTSEQKLTSARVRHKSRQFIDRLLRAHGPCVVWAHNLGLGRNLPLASALHEVCAATATPLMLHHHDWWFDNRWNRWAEMRQGGLRKVTQVADAIFGHSPECRHAAINQADTRILQTHFGERAQWLPNPGCANARPDRAAVANARAWLATLLGSKSPFWLMPCRLLRRKNIAEALLLKQWLAPDAVLVTTGGPSSAEERPYANALARAARTHDWPLHLSVLAGTEAGRPSIPSLMAASEAVLLTSLQEGFGLPYLEATAAGKPLVARALPNVMPDLAQLGFRFPYTYTDILVERSMFNLKAERSRQERLYRRWRTALPLAARRCAGLPVLLASASGPVPFSRLTLRAQLQVLSLPIADSWASCVRLNPFLQEWRHRAGRAVLQPARWPAQATKRLQPRAYATAWCGLLERRALPAGDGDAHSAQAEFIQARVVGENLYPLLWS